MKTNRDTTTIMSNIKTELDENGLVDTSKNIILTKEINDQKEKELKVISSNARYARKRISIILPKLQRLQTILQEFVDVSEEEIEIKGKKKQCPTLLDTRTRYSTILAVLSSFQSSVLFSLQL